MKEKINSWPTLASNPGFAAAHMPVVERVEGDL
jgi:hypothetical protein